MEKKPINKSRERQPFSNIVDESAYRAIFESTGVASMIVIEDTHIILANRECEQVTGYPPEKLVGQSWTGFVAKESLKRMLKYHRLRRIDPQKAPNKYEVKLIHRDGTIRDTILSVRMIPGSSNSIISMQDVTDLRKTQQELADQENRYRSLFECSPVGIVVADKKGKMLDTNPALLKIYGLPKANLIGKSAFTLVRKYLTMKELPRVLKVIKDALAGKIIEPSNFEYQDKILEISASINPMEKTVVGIISDITKQKQSEKALKENEQKYRLLFENMLDSFALHKIVLNKKGAPVDYIFLEVNQAFERQTGLKREDILGKKVT